jgi:diguanylate cyclase (GGDEF)-like protein
MCSHRVQFYDSDAFLLKTLLEFVEPARLAGDGVVVIATRDHLDLERAALSADANPVRRDARDDCVLLEARETLATFMADGMPDEQRFVDVVGGLVRQVSDNGSRQVFAFGEMVAVLYADGNAEAAVRLEQLWEKLVQNHRLSLLCAYPLSAFPDDVHRHAFQCICAAHSHVNPIERLGASNEPDELYRTIALLQQRANSLESELHRRQHVEHVLTTQTARIAVMDTAHAELENLAGQDPLTGLSNRRIFSDRLAHAAERAARTGSALALIFIDLDEFKTLNDINGHAAGDQLLVQVATRLSLCVRSADTLCRWGGDEFAVIMEDADAAQSGVLMRRIETVLKEAFVLGNASINLSASIGFSLCPGDAADVYALVDNADAAMYRAKRAGKGRNNYLPSSATQEPGSHAAKRGVGAPEWLTVEAAAGKLLLSRPHVLKLIAEQRFNNVVAQKGGMPLIPLHEVTRVARELHG